MAPDPDTSTEEKAAAERAAADGAEQPAGVAPEPAQPEELSAAAPPDREGRDRGETAFTDAEAPGAGRPAPREEAGEDAGDVVEHDLEALLARARERDEYLQLAQRTQADFENYRKRMARETAQAGERGVSRLARELLPALDHLELALKAASETGDASASEVVKGFRLVHGELVGALGRVGIEPFSPAGEPFDPNEHEAMASQPREGAASGTVIEVYQQGYRINGAVLRPARVVVAA